MERFEPIAEASDVRTGPPLTREERRSLALHEAIANRLRELPGATLALAHANLHRMRERHPGAAQLLQEWDLLLAQPLDALIPLLTDPSERARELRHVTPFGGALSAPERTVVYQAFARHERGEG